MTEVSVGSVVCMDRIQLNALLLHFEDAYREGHGSALGSKEFYERYTRGEFDDPWFMAWATYYEAYTLHEKNRSQAPGAVEKVVESLAPPAVLA